MNIPSFIKSSYKICSSKYLGIKYPVFFIFELTYRCDLKCSYCSRWDGQNYSEADTQTICRIIEEAKRLGLLRVYFTGGQIFLRRDIKEIVKFCKKLRIMVECWINGRMLSENIDILKYTDSITLSLDGSEVVHDTLRGKDSFTATLHAARLAKKYGVNVSFNFTLTSYNTNYFMEAAAISSSLGATISFQPVSELARGRPNIKDFFPSKKEFDSELHRVSALKTKFPRLIENSVHHLGYLKSWPKIKQWNCLHGRAIFTILPDATMVTCTNSSIAYPEPVDLKYYSVAEAILHIHPFQCNGCVCYGAYDASGGGSILPVSWEVFKFHVLNKWKKREFEENNYKNYASFHRK